MTVYPGDITPSTSESTGSQNTDQDLNVEGAVHPVARPNDTQAIGER
jgi:hypothetical protein